MNILIIIIACIPISFAIKGLIDKFIKEEDMVEEYEKDHEEELSKKLSKEEKKKHLEEINKLKVPFKAKFSIPILLSLIILELILYYFKGISLEFFAYSFLTCILLISFVTDLKKCIIPNETNYACAVVGVCYALFRFFEGMEKKSMDNSGIDLLLGGVVAFLFFFMIAGITYLIIKKEGLGGGDVKLVAGIGFFMGLKNFIQIFVLAYILAAIICLFLLILRKKDRKDYIPLGPFLCIATYFTMIVPFLTTATWWLKQLYKYNNIKIRG